MARLYVRHPVNNYATWCAAYDSSPDFRAANGVTGQAVYESIDDPNDVTVWHDFDTVEAAQAFAALDELKDVMKGAGVAGPPSVWVVTETD